MRLPILLPFLALRLLAAAPLPMAAPIQSVRLHPDEAWVTRIGHAHAAAAGSITFLIRDLPPGLGLDDVRVAARGPQGTRLGDLVLAAEVRKVTESPEFRALKKEREEARDRQDALEAGGEVLLATQIRAPLDGAVSGLAELRLP